jgi:hypothetical protein
MRDSTAIWIQAIKEFGLTVREILKYVVIIAASGGSGYALKQEDPPVLTNRDASEQVVSNK